LEKKSCDDGAEALASKAREGGRVGSGAEAGEEHASDAAEDADVADWGFVGGEEKGRGEGEEKERVVGGFEVEVEFFWR